ncbi:MAG TPA: hypothetical protein VM223_05650 [Planctomycetota bacterium]|nr:hypothetical protein [Planctomycetota bacterium]
METRQYGIAGMPRGATHYAASLFQTGHEDLNEVGMADYLLPTPRWPEAPSFRRMKRFYIERPNVTFNERLTVVRDPFRVLASIEANDDHRLCVELCALLGRDAEGMPEVFSTNLDYDAHVLMRWYHRCLLWSGGESFQAESGKDLSLGRMNPQNPRLSDSDIKIHLHPFTLEALLALREGLGYA